MTVLITLSKASYIRCPQYNLRKDCIPFKVINFLRYSKILEERT